MGTDVDLYNRHTYDFIPANNGFITATYSQLKDVYSAVVSSADSQMIIQYFTDERVGYLSNMADVTFVADDYYLMTIPFQDSDKLVDGILMYVKHASSEHVQYYTSELIDRELGNTSTHPFHIL